MPWIRSRHSCGVDLRDDERGVDPVEVRVRRPERRDAVDADSTPAGQRAPGPPARAARAGARAAARTGSPSQPTSPRRRPPRPTVTPAASEERPAAGSRSERPASGARPRRREQATARRAGAAPATLGSTASSARRRPGDRRDAPPPAPSTTTSAVPARERRRASTPRDAPRAPCTTAADRRRAATSLSLVPNVLDRRSPSASRRRQVDEGVARRPRPARRPGPTTAATTLGAPRASAPPASDARGAGRRPPRAARRLRGSWSRLGSAAGAGARGSMPARRRILPHAAPARPAFARVTASGVSRAARGQQRPQRAAAVADRVLLRRRSARRVVRSLARRGRRPGRSRTRPLPRGLALEPTVRRCTPSRDRARRRPGSTSAAAQTKWAPAVLVRDVGELGEQQREVRRVVAVPAAQRAVKTPGAPPSTSTTSPESSATAGSPVACGHRARLEQRVLGEGHAALDDVGQVGERVRRRPPSSTSSPAAPARIRRSSRTLCGLRVASTSRGTVDRLRRDRPAPAAAARCSSSARRSRATARSSSASSSARSNGAPSAVPWTSTNAPAPGHHDVHVGLGAARPRRSAGRASGLPSTTPTLTAATESGQRLRLRTEASLARPTRRRRRARRRRR